MGKGKMVEPEPVKKLLKKYQLMLDEEIAFKIQVGEEEEERIAREKSQQIEEVGTSQRVDTSDDTIMDDVSKHRRIIASMDADVGVTLKDVADIAKEVAVDAEIEENADVQERQA
uniref:Uncharacterized protein n=1 Tax=Tanacetum cinerariifolium TaxID=118510 RepID=A0A699RNX8_TANCI|nr:hypothetical protein [Tanacetum cinerariifolium]